MDSYSDWNNGTKENLDRTFRYKQCMAKIVNIIIFIQGHILWPYFQQLSKIHYFKTYMQILTLTTSDNDKIMINKIKNNKVPRAITYSRLIL